MLALSASPESSLVSDAQRDVVAVEALENRLRCLPRSAEEVAGAGQRNRPLALALRDDEIARAVVLGTLEDEAAREAHLSVIPHLTRRRCNGGDGLRLSRRLEHGGGADGLPGSQQHAVTRCRNDRIPEP